VAADAVLEQAVQQEEELVNVLFSVTQGGTDNSTTTTVTVITDVGTTSASLLSTDSTSDPEPVVVEGVSISLPAAALTQVADNGTSGADTSFVLVVTVYAENSTASFADQANTEEEAEVVATPVSITLVDSNGNRVTVKDLDVPIEVTLQVTEDETDTTTTLVCAFWDEELGQWSTDGLTRLTDRVGFVCATTHLTVFSAIKRAVSDFLAPFQCVTVSVLTDEAPGRVWSKPGWMRTVSGIVLILAILVQGFALAIAARENRPEQWSDLNLFVDDKLEEDSMRVKIAKFLEWNKVKEELRETIAHQLIAFNEQVSAADVKTLAVQSGNNKQKISARRPSLFSNLSVPELRIEEAGAEADPPPEEWAQPVSNDAQRSMVKKEVRMDPVVPVPEAFDEQQDGVCSDVGTADENDSGGGLQRDLTVFTRNAHEAIHDFRAISLQGRAWRLFVTMHAIVTLQHFSYSQGARTRGLLLLCRLNGTMYCVALSLQILFGVSTEDSDSRCYPQNFFGNLGRNFLVSLISFLLGFLPVLGMSILATKSFVHASSWSAEKRRKQMRQWYIRTAIVWVLASLYNIFCLFYVVTFLANTGVGGRVDWTTSVAIDLVNLLLVRPFLLAMAMALVLDILHEPEDDGPRNSNVPSAMVIEFMPGARPREDDPFSAVVPSSAPALMPIRSNSASSIERMNSKGIFEDYPQDVKPEPPAKPEVWDPFNTTRVLGIPSQIKTAAADAAERLMTILDLQADQGFQEAPPLPPNVVPEEEERRETNPVRSG